MLCLGDEIVFEVWIIECCGSRRHKIRAEFHSTRFSDCACKKCEAARCLINSRRSKMLDILSTRLSNIVWDSANLLPRQHPFGSGVCKERESALAILSPCRFHTACEFSAREQIILGESQCIYTHASEYVRRALCASADLSLRNSCVYMCVLLSRWRWSYHSLPADCFRKGASPRCTQLWWLSTVSAVCSFLDAPIMWLRLSKVALLASYVVSWLTPLKLHGWKALPMKWWLCRWNEISLPPTSHAEDFSPCCEEIKWGNCINQKSWPLFLSKK
jgi:hypothetical protein